MSWMGWRGLSCVEWPFLPFVRKKMTTMALVNRIVATLSPERMAKQTRPRRPTRHSTPFSSVLQLGWVDFGWIALTKSQQARTKQFESLLERIYSVTASTSNCQKIRWRCAPSSVFQLLKPLLLLSKQTRGKWRNRSKSSQF